MEDIEYLEEYEDLVLPALNSAAAAAAISSTSFQSNKIQEVPKINDVSDDSSSSLDQDIFNCLFDDNSDDDDFNDFQNSELEPTVKQKTESQEFIENLHKTPNEIVAKVIEKVEISRQDQTKGKVNNIAKTGNKNIPTTPKLDTFGSTTKDNKETSNAPLTTFVKKTKSIATVRPTVQHQKQKGPNPSTSALSTSNLITKKQGVCSLSTEGSTTVPKKINKHPTSIVKLGKIKHPPHDPLDLDELSEVGSYRYSLSDISGETSNCISDFEDDESSDEYISGDDDYCEDEYNEEGISSSSQIIELSNDSSSAPSNFEDLRAPTPSPVISDGGDTPSSSSGFKINTTKSVKPYSHPDIIKSVLTKGDKPKLLELLQKYNLLEDSVENLEEDNSVICITTSTENLVAGADSRQVETLKNTIEPNTVKVEVVSLNTKDHTDSLTLNTTNKDQTKNSKKLNKNKSKKKSVTNMDTDLNSPGDVSTDSDLSAVEELLEESYAAAMKRIQNAPLATNGAGAETEIGGCDIVTTIEENQQELPNTGVVIDFNSQKEGVCSINKKVETNKARRKNQESQIDNIKHQIGFKNKYLETNTVDEKNQKIDYDNVNKEMDSKNKVVETNALDQKNIILDKNKKLLQNELGLEKETKDSEQTKQMEIVKVNLDNLMEKELKGTSIECHETAEILEKEETSSVNSASDRKKKRFRNLVTPELTEQGTAKSIDDIKDFKGFEEDETKYGKIFDEIERPNSPTIEKSDDKKLKIEKDCSFGSFKSPSNSHQSLKDKFKEYKEKNSRDNSESKDKSSRYSKNSRGSSKDRRSRESSTDKSSRENSRDHSHKTSKDRSKHIRHKESSSKSHYRDQRKSSDSKESSISRESSKSGDSKETKTDTKYSHKATSTKKDHLSESNKVKPSGKECKKANETNNLVKEIVKFSFETKIIKEPNEVLKDLKSSFKSIKSGDSTEFKNVKLSTQKNHSADPIKEKSNEKKDKKSNETDNHAREIVKSTTESKSIKGQESKKETRELKTEKKDKTTAETIQKLNKKNSIIRDCSEEEINISQTIDFANNIHQTKSPQQSKNLKASKSLYKSVTDKLCTSATADSVKLSEGLQEIKNVQKSSIPSEESKYVKKVAKSANVKNTSEKNIIENPKISQSAINTSKISISPKSAEVNSKDASSSDSKIKKMDDQTNRIFSDINDIFDDKNLSNKIPSKSDVLNKTKTKIATKETVATISNVKYLEASDNYGLENTNTAKPISENAQKYKPVFKLHETNTKERSSDSRKLKETLKSTRDTVDEKINVSQKKAVKFKEENIKKNQAGNQQQIDPKSTNTVSSVNSEKLSTENTTKLDPMKIKDVRSALDAITGSEKKDIVQYKIGASEINKNGRELVSVDGNQIKENKASKESSKKDIISKEYKAKNSEVHEQKVKDIEKNKIVEKFENEAKIEKINISDNTDKKRKAKEFVTRNTPETSKKKQNSKDIEKSNFAKVANIQEKKRYHEKNTIAETNNKNHTQNEEETNKNAHSSNKEQKIRYSAENRAQKSQSEVPSDIAKNKFPQINHKKRKGKDIDENETIKMISEERKHEKEITKTIAPETLSNEQKTKNEIIKRDQMETQKCKVSEIRNNEPGGKPTVERENIETSKNESIDNQILSKIETQINTDKTKMKESITAEKCKVSKTLKKARKPHVTAAGHNKYLNESAKKIKQIEKSEDISHAVKEKMETVESQIYCVNEDERPNVSLKSIKTQDVKNEIILKGRKKRVKEDASNESSKIKRIMESVLDKSLVVLIEPLQSISQYKTNIGSEIKNSKLIDSVNTMDQKYVQDISANTETKIARKSILSTPSEKNEKKESESERKNCNSESVESRDVIEIESNATKTDARIEKSDAMLYDTIHLAKETKSSADSKTERQKDIVEPINATRHKVCNSEKEKCEKFPKDSSNEKCTTLQEEKLDKIKVMQVDSVGEKSSSQKQIKNETVEQGKAEIMTNELSHVKASGESGNEKLKTTTNDKIKVSAKKTAAMFQMHSLQANSLPELEFIKDKSDVNSESDEKEKTELTTFAPSDEKTSLLKENEPVKTRRRDFKDDVPEGETHILENNPLDANISAQIECKENIIEPAKNELCVDERESEEEKNQIKIIEPSYKKSSVKKENESIKTRSGDTRKEGTGKGTKEVDNKSSTQEELKEYVAPIKKRGRSDISRDGKSSTEKEICSKKAKIRSNITEENVKGEIELLPADSLGNQCFTEKKFSDEHSEAIKSTRRGDLNSEAEKEKQQIKQVEWPQEEVSSKKVEPITAEMLEIDLFDANHSGQKKFKEHNETIKAGTHGDLKDGAGKDKINLSEVDLSENKNSDKEANRTDIDSSPKKFSAEEIEPPKERRRCDLKEESEKEKVEITQVCSEETKSCANVEFQDEHFETVKTRKCGDLGTQIEEKKELVNIRKCADLKIESENSTQVGLLRTQCSPQKQLEAEILDSVKSRKRVDIKGDEKQKTERLQIELSDQKKFNQIEFEKKHFTSGDRQKVDIKEYTELSPIELSNTVTSDQQTTELKIGGVVSGEHGVSKKNNLYEKPKEENIENLKIEPIETRRNCDLKGEFEGVKESPQDDLTSEQIFVEKINKYDYAKDIEHHFEPRRTRSRLGQKEELEKRETSQKDLMKDPVDQMHPEIKNITKKGKSITIKSTEKYFNDPKHMDKDAMQIALGDDYNKTEVIKTRRRGDLKIVTSSAGNTDSKICGENVVFTADEHKSDELMSKVLNNETKKNQSAAFQTNWEIEKISEENFCSDNEMSGCESSNSDSTFRRTLRKRRTDSPYADNDNKNMFKEPIPKSTTFLTPKNSKTEKAASNALSSSTKRTSRFLASEAEGPSSSKRPKLDKSKKSTSFHNTRVDISTEEIATEEHISKEQKLVVMDKQTLNISNTIPKNSQIKYTEGVYDTFENTTVSEKNIEEKLNKGRIAEMPMNVLEKEVHSTDITLPEGAQNIDRTLNLNLGKATNVKQSEKVGNEIKIFDSTLQAKSNKAKEKASPNKSAGASTVLTFSDWLKCKNQNITNEVPATTKDRRSKMTPITSDSKLTEDKYGITTATVLANTAIMNLNKEEVLAAEGRKEKSNILEKYSKSDDEFLAKGIDIPQKHDKSLLQLSDYHKKQENIKRRSKKVTVKRLGASKKVSKKPPKIQTSPTKSSATNSTSGTNSTNNTSGSLRLKRSETDILIESMSKEMKDAGITDLLRTGAQVKRQRLPNRRIRSDSIEKETFTSVANLPTVHNAIINPSENREIQTKNTNRFPVKRKLQQNSAKLRKEISKEDIVNSTAIRQSTAARVRKSMPAMPKESQDKITHVPNRKSLILAKTQHLKEESESPTSNLFKTPTLLGSSTTQNKPLSAPSSIKPLLATDIKKSESRAKIQQKENLLSKFNCRKLSVRIDRLAVENFINNTNKNGKQILTTDHKAARKEIPSTSNNSLPLIENKSESSLRIYSVMDASTILKAVSPAPKGKDQTDINVASTSTSAKQQPFILPSERDNVGPLSTSIVTAPGTNETFELKHEFVDEHPIGLLNDAILPDTSTLLARAQTITEAAQHALSNSVTPTDIRILATDSSENNFVPSFGVTPRTLDSKGTCLYSFLHPAKYNRNHSNVLLDYCCPNLDGPMPAIDPTRIHAQVQVPTIELPASIVLTTKIVTRADLESESSSIPAIIRKKAEKIRKNMATHHKLAVATTTNTQPTLLLQTPNDSHLISAPTPSLPPTINALTKQLPSATTITPKLCPPMAPHPQTLVDQHSASIASSVKAAFPKNNIVSVIPKKHLSQLTNVQQSSLRSNLRRFDILLKELVQPYENLTFVERHRIIEAIIKSGNYLPNDVDRILVLMEEYLKQMTLLKLNDSTAIVTTNNFGASQPAVVSSIPTAQMPQLQPSPKILASNLAPLKANTYSPQFDQLHNQSIKMQGRGSTSKTSPSSRTVVVKQQQVPIYDTDSNIIGYHMQIVPPMSSMHACRNSTMSCPSPAIVSSSRNARKNKMASYAISKRPLRRPAQDSPRVFYTTLPSKTSTPKATSNSNLHLTHHAKNANTIAQKTQGSIVTTVHSGGLSSTGSSETITTTTTATVKRVTRSTATGSKIIILSKSNQSSEETILPDANSTEVQTEIKNEKDVEEFLG